MIRINRVAVNIGIEPGDLTIISLYRTNTKLVEITNNVLDIPDFIESDTDRNTYQSYCKDVVVNLLENGGIEGYYWEPKAQGDESQTKKYDRSTFRNESIAKVCEILDAIIDGTEIKYEVNKFKGDDVNVTDKYKDMHIKYGDTDVIVTITNNGKTIQVTIKCEIRSGQLCKPKTFTANQQQYQLNYTTIVRLMK